MGFSCRDALDPIPWRLERTCGDERAVASPQRAGAEDQDPDMAVLSRCPDGDRGRKPRRETIRAGRRPPGSGSCRPEERRIRPNGWKGCEERMTQSRGALPGSDVECAAGLVGAGPRARPLAEGGRTRGSGRGGYLPAIMAAMSPSAVPMRSMPNFSTSTPAAPGERNPGSVGPGRDAFHGPFHHRRGILGAAFRPVGHVPGARTAHRAGGEHPVQAAVLLLDRDPFSWGPRHGTGPRPLSLRIGGGRTKTRCPAPGRPAAGRRRRRRSRRARAASSSGCGSPAPR